MRGISKKRNIKKNRGIFVPKRSLNLIIFESLGLYSLRLLVRAWLEIVFICLQQNKKLLNILKILLFIVIENT